MPVTLAANFQAILS